ncbi:MAG: YjbH domain-containing protein [Rhodobacterales bacterium]
MSGSKLSGPFGQDLPTLSHLPLSRLLHGCIACITLWGTAALAQDRPGHAIPSFSLNGGPGIVDMPSADVAPDATLSTTLSYFSGTTRGTVSFQITPRLSGSFRYAGVDGLTELGGRDIPDYDLDVYYDRSFDLRYQVMREGQYLPSLTVGMQDFVGTALYGAEYIVASKGLSPAVRVTAGLGWGRLGSYRPLGSIGTRSTDLLEQGGVPSYDRWFRGDVAAFGGVTWEATDRLTFKAEYTSDAYVEEAANGVFTPKTPWNFGLDYRFRNGAQASLVAMQGAAIGAQLTLHTNPKSSGVAGGIETAPVPVYRRSAQERGDLGWTQDSVLQTAIPSRLSEAMTRDGLVFGGLILEERRASVRLINPTYGPEPQAIGRTARIMARNLPGSVETFVIVPVVNGMALSAVTLQRSDLEDLENAPASAILARAGVQDGHRRAPPQTEDRRPALTWSLNPYLRYGLFDPDNPLRADVGAELKASYRISPGLVLSGGVSKRLAGNMDSVTRRDPSALPRVRTDYALYAREGDPSLDYLTLTGYARPGPDLYARMSFGYLEEMYAGVSAEVLWKPVDSRFALGAEINYAHQRDFDQLFGLRDYNIVTGHVSAYYDFGNGFHGQLDVGRYLAGDVGATLSLDREFANGWRIGTFATLTDVSPEDFGEGSFDKGFRVTIPLGPSMGTPTRRTANMTIRPLTRDGGARLELQDRLYEQVRDYHSPELEKKWGRFWR